MPFIARYRKEQTGNLDEVAIRQVIDAKERWDEILKRQAFIVEEIERQGKLTPELKEQLLATFDLDALEDLYLPVQAEAEDQGHGRARGGPRAAGRLALGLRPRRRCRRRPARRPRRARSPSATRRRAWPTSPPRWRAPATS